MGGFDQAALRWDAAKRGAGKEALLSGLLKWAGLDTERARLLTRYGIIKERY
jgi:hypothetical protein